MRTNKFSLLTSIVACGLAVFGMVGCSSDCTVTVKEIKGDNQEYRLTVNAGETVTMNMLAEKYRDKFTEDTGLFRDKNLYVDEQCLVKFVGGVNDNITLYFGSYSPMTYEEVVFDYNNEQYAIYRAKGSTLTAEDFSRSAYGYGDAADYVFYSDSARATELDISSVEIGKNNNGNTIYSSTVIYVANAV